MKDGRGRIVVIEDVVLGVFRVSIVEILIEVNLVIVFYFYRFTVKWIYR